MDQDTDYASPEQRAYARWLDAGTRIGFVALVGTFAVYLLGVLPPHVAVADLPRYWTMPVDEYLAATGAPRGWGWLRQLHEGDYLNFVGIAILALVTVVCYLRVLPIFARAGERALAAICVAEVLVLALAVSGLVGGGH